MIISDHFVVHSNRLKHSFLCLAGWLANSHYNFEKFVCACVCARPIEVAFMVCLLFRRLIFALLCFLFISFIAFLWFYDASIRLFPFKFLIWYTKTKEVEVEKKKQQPSQMVVFVVSLCGISCIHFSLSSLLCLCCYQIAGMFHR